MKKYTQRDVPKLKRKLWKVFSLWIKTRDKFTCFTCGRKGEGQGMHCGHYIPKSICGPGLYFHELNNHAQCFNCNINLGGYGAMYDINMTKKYGQEEVDKLWKIKADMSLQWDWRTLVSQIAYYTNQLKIHDN